MKIYKYVGPGAGVIGLPNEVTREEAKRRGVEKTLDACIANRLYVEMSPKVTKKDKSKSEQESPNKGV